jgi:hypothetical protein
MLMGKSQLATHSLTDYLFFSQFLGIATGIQPRMVLCQPDAQYTEPTIHLA